MSKQMVALTSQHAMTMTRAQMEAHLVLQGWEPFQVGTSGGMRKDCDVYYVFGRKRSSHQVNVGHQTLAGMNLITAEQIAARQCDDWFMSDDIFWPLAHHCAVHDNKGASDGYGTKNR